MTLARRCYIAAAASLSKAKTHVVTLLPPPRPLPSPPPQTTPPRPLPSPPPPTTYLSLSLSLGPSSSSSSSSPRRKQQNQYHKTDYCSLISNPVSEIVAGEEKRRSLSSLLLPSPTTKTSVSLTLSLGPSSPRNHYELINDLLSSTNSSVVDGEEINTAMASATNNDKQSNNIPEIEEISTATATATNNKQSNVVAVSENHSSGIGLGGLLLLEDCLKKREYNPPLDKKKRKRAENEDSCNQLLLLPLKKRRSSFFVADDVLIFKIEKPLTESDVNDSSRLLLGNKTKIAKLLSNMNLTGDEQCFQDPKHGKEIIIYDSDTGKETTLMLRRWKTKSYVLNTGWRDKFVKAKNLKKGDVIQLQWDQVSKRLNYSLVVNNKV